MNTCETYAALLDLFVDGELSLEEMLEVQTHLDECPACRIDFLAEGVGIEVKKGRPVRATVLKQVARYLACEQVDALILVSEKEIRLPATVGGKPVKTLSLSRFWGVALP